MAHLLSSNRKTFIMPSFRASSSVFFLSILHSLMHELPRVNLSFLQVHIQAPTSNTFSSGPSASCAYFRCAFRCLVLFDLGPYLVTYKSIYLKQTKFVLMYVCMYVCMTRIEIHNFKNIAMNYTPMFRGTTPDGFSEKRNKIGPILFK